MIFLYCFLPVLLVLILGVGFGVSIYMTKRRPRSAFHTAADYGLASEEIRFAASDGLLLQGCWIPAAGEEPDRPKRAVIILHGHGGSLDWDLHRAPALHAAGFNVFLFDFRAHGRSEGKLETFGYLERRDVLGAVAYLKSRGVERIGLLGFSYGGMASILSAPLCPAVKAVVSDGGPVRLRTAIATRSVELHVPPWLARPLAWLTVAVTSLRVGANLFRYEPVRWVGKISPRPILFIHGELDHYCPDFDDLYAAARLPKKAWRLPGVGHTEASLVYPEEFRRKVIGFFDQNL